MMNLRTNIGNLELKNPVLTASGTFGYGVEFSDFVNLDNLGGFIVKGTTGSLGRAIRTRAWRRRRWGC